MIIDSIATHNVDIVQLISFRNVINENRSGLLG